MKIAFALLLLASASIARAQGTASQLAERGAAALNSRRAAAFAALAAPHVDTGWVRDVAAAPDPANRKWVGGVLNVHGQTWVVFSLDKMVEMDHDHFYRAAKRSGKWALTGNVDEAEPGRHWRITRHAETAFLYPRTRMGNFVDGFTVRPLGPGGWPLVFDLGHEYRLYSMEICRDPRTASHGRPGRFTRAGNLIRLDTPVHAGETVLIGYQRTFHTKPNFLSSIASTDALLYADWLPVISYQPAPSVITLDTPAGWNSIAQHTRPVFVRRDRNRIARTFINDAPVSFIMAAAGPYTVSRRRMGRIPLETYMLGYSREKAERGLATMAYAYPFYTAHFGAIPWKEYTLVEVKALQGLAQEGYSFSVYSTGSFPGSSAHELGHSWWGGRVNNTYFGSYWNESLTSYSTDMVNESLFGARTAHSNRISEMRHYRMGITGGDLPLMKASQTPWSPRILATTYNKGALVCHMLRRELGGAVFFRTLRRFAAEYAGRAAEWDDLARVSSEEAHRPMGWFFTQWTRRAGGLRLHWENVRATPVSGGSLVTATLVQEGAPFKAHVPVRVESGRGNATTTLWVAGARTPLRIRVAGVPRRIVADPDDDLLREPDLSEMPPDPDLKYFGHHPLVVVYGTHGTPQMNAIMKRQAQGEVKHFGETNDGVFSDLSSITAVADTDVTPAQKRDANFILVGRPGDNALMDGVAATLPLRLTPGGFAMNGKTHTGPGLVAITNTPNPWNRARLLTTWSGGDAAAMALPREVTNEGNYGNFFGLSHAAFLAAHGRVLDWNDAGVTERRTYVFGR